MSDAKKEAVRRLKREAAIHYRHKRGHQGTHNSMKFAESLQNCYALGVTVSEAEAIIDEICKEEG